MGDKNDSIMQCVKYGILCTLAGATLIKFDGDAISTVLDNIIEEFN